MNIFKTFLATSAILAIVSSQAAAKTELKLDTINFKWIEVPNTTFGNDRAGEVHSNNAYISVYQVINQSLVEFDIVTSLNDYHRVMGDCRQSKFKHLRQGYFQSNNAVTYAVPASQYWYDTNEFQKQLLVVACSQ